MPRISWSAWLVGLVALSGCEGSLLGDSDSANAGVPQPPSGGASVVVGAGGAAAGSPSGGGTTGGGAIAGSTTGGGAIAGSATGGNPTGGSATGGVGGVASGGNPSGGAALGGESTGGNAGQPAAGGGGAGQAGGGAASGGAPPSGNPDGVDVTTHDLSVPSGKVFNVADNYFRDTFSPATPVANFGLHSQIITVANDDGSLDVAWLDYTNGSSRPWALDTAAPIYLTHIAADLGSATTQSSGISSYKLLGFTKDTAGAFYLAYNKDHPQKNGTQGNANNLNGNELHVTKLSGGTPQWDQLLFGNQDNAVDGSKGDPGGAASGVLGYDPTNQKLVLYCGHSMMWTPTRHQAGFLRLLEPSTGAVLPPHGDDVIHFGSGWFYSHNFNQRLLIDGGKYYVLAHGDAYARQLGFARWSPTGYSNNNAPDFDKSYFAISGNTGDNKTDTQTGQLAKMPDGRFLMVFATSQGRSARDVRLVFASGSDGTTEPNSAAWLTNNVGTTHATMPKVELLGSLVLVTYALWDSSKGHALTWYAALLDTTLAVVAPPKAVAGVEFVDSAPLFRFKGGPNAGAVGWVSGNASHTLSVRVATASYP